MASSLAEPRINVRAVEGHRAWLNQSFEDTIAAEQRNGNLTLCQRCLPYSHLQRSNC